MLTFETYKPVLFSNAEKIAKKVGLEDSSLAAFLDISPKTFSRRRQSGKLEAAESLRLEMLESIYELTEQVLGKDRATGWLTGGLVGLGGRAPIEILNSIEGYETVRNSLYRQAHGMF